MRGVRAEHQRLGEKARGDARREAGRQEEKGRTELGSKEEKVAVKQLFGARRSEVGWHPRARAVRSRP